jgi:D-glycero-D-manno-heptose 1,7-bisphosphate phosphatase
MFLDGDGVIVVPEFRDQRSFAPRRLEDFRLYPEAAAILHRLERAGFLPESSPTSRTWETGDPRAEVDAMHEIMRRELPIETTPTGQEAP